jgi:hypothetical protein
MNKFAALFFLGLTLLWSGCSSLRPPAEDRAVWEYEQQQGMASAQEKSPANLIYPLLTGVGAAMGH